MTRATNAQNFKRLVQADEGWDCTKVRIRQKRIIEVNFKKSGVHIPALKLWHGDECENGIIPETLDIMNVYATVAKYTPVTNLTYILHSLIKWAQNENSIKIQGN